jgi:hypothetical protein
MKASGIRPAFAARDPVSDPNRWRRRQIAINKATDILKLLVEAIAAAQDGAAPRPARDGQRLRSGYLRLDCTH